MKLETLVTRYKKLGYKPQGLERDLEIAAIIKWIYEKYDIYIDAQYCSLGFTHYKQFTGFKIWHSKQDHNNRIWCDEHFDNPFDAKFDAVKSVYRAIKFQFH